MLPPELQRQAVRTARQRGISLGELIRQSLVRETATVYRAEADAFWNTPKLFHSGLGTLSADHDSELYGPIRH